MLSDVSDTLRSSGDKSRDAKDRCSDGQDKDTQGRKITAERVTNDRMGKGRRVLRRRGALVEQYCPSQRVVARAVSGAHTPGGRPRFTPPVGAPQRRYASGSEEHGYKQNGWDERAAPRRTKRSSERTFNPYSTSASISLEDPSAPPSADVVSDQSAWNVNFDSVREICYIVRPRCRPDFQ
jgi:hypothetical protein